MRSSWACIAAVCAAVRLFAVQEPDGGEWQDQKQLSFGREPSRAAFFTFATEKESLALDAGFVTWKAGEPVPFSTISLDYEADDASESPWRFKWSKDPASRPVGFQSPAYDISSWEGICVPCSWQAINAKGKRKGRWGRPIYTNGIIYPFAVNPPRVMDTPPKWYTNFTERNPVGSYRRDFDVPETWTQDEVFLKFDGVDSFFYLWVNGQYVGFSKDSRNPAEFNVKKFVKPGRNTVALEVYRNSDGSYLEDQDMFRLSGIFRHTWLIRRPANRIRDFFVTAAPVREGDFAGDWEMKVKVEGDGGGEGEGSGEVWTVSLFTLDGQPVLKKEIKNPTSSTSATPTTSATCILHLTSPKLWNAETPNCYTVVVGNGREFASTLFGFRVSEIKNGRYYLNGQKIKLHGANRHETDPGYGHYTPRSLMEEDIRLLKRANCNAVRNSHYPQDDYWYRLCDLNGIYLVDEANMESHGMGFGKRSLAHRPEWREATVQRSLDMIARNKNHPSVIIWSYGNESGGGANFTAAGEAVREADPTRPRHYEGDNTKADIDSVMYPSVDRVWREARNAKRTRPFYLCEYAHNMVNAMGNLKDYEDAIQSSDVVIGGTIWDWVDQGLYKEVEKTGGGGEGKMIIGFGGDFGDAPNDGQFVMNGCVLSDRSLEPGYFEIKHVFQPFTATPTEDGRSIRLLNRNFFRTGAYCTCEWTATVNGVGLEDARQTFVRGTFDIADLAPRATKVVPVPTEALALRGPCRTVAVRVRFLQREAEGVVEKGYVVADDQIDLKAESPAKPLVCTGGAVSVDETGDAVRFATSAGMRYGFSRKTGCLTSVVAANGEEQLLSPMALDAFRCPSSNEIRPADAALRSGLRVLSASLLSFGAVEGTKEGGQTFTTTVRYRGVRREEQSGYGNVQMTLKDRGSVRKSDAVRFTVCSRWTVLPSGELLCRSEIKGSGRAIDLLRIGYRFTLRGKKAQVSWFGRGPFENYRDRKSGAFVSRWSRPLDDLFVPYARNEDCGNMEDVSRVDVETEHGGIGFTTLARPFAFQACRWSPTELMTYTHPSDLPAVPAKAEIAILAATRGLGGRSCGPDTLARDRIGSRGTYRLDFAIGAPSSDDHTAYSHDDLPLPTVTGREPFFKPVEASSFEPHEGEICHIADGDPDTYWHTRWNGKNVPRHPHWIVLDAGKSVGLAGLTVLGRQDSNLNGTIKTLRVETSEDRVSWSIVREATLPLSDGVQELRFAQPTTGRYVRLTALESHNGDVWAQIAEVTPILEP